jgi:hypothetical protein
MDIADIRKRVKLTIDQSRREGAARRTRADAAAATYETFLERVAAPLFKQVAAILIAERYPFQVFTPGGGLRLSSDRASEDYIELHLDAATDPPVVLGRVSRSRGSRVLTVERPIREGVAVADLTEADLLEFVLKEIRPFVER